MEENNIFGGGKQIFGEENKIVWRKTIFLGVENKVAVQGLRTSLILGTTPGDIRLRELL